jgi:WD40 repeat protein
MKWTANGEKICIIYEDGAVIVGSVDGNRLWGKELNLTLSLVEWSPDGRLVLFSTKEGDVHIYDSNGNGVTKVPLYCNEGYSGTEHCFFIGCLSQEIGYPALLKYLMIEDADICVLLWYSGCHAGVLRFSM